MRVAPGVYPLYPPYPRLVRQQLVGGRGQVRVEAERARERKLLVGPQRADAVAGAAPPVDVLVRVADEDERGAVGALLRITTRFRLRRWRLQIGPAAVVSFGRRAKGGSRGEIEDFRAAWSRKSFIVSGVMSCASSCG